MLKTTVCISHHGLKIIILNSLWKAYGQLSENLAYLCPDNVCLIINNEPSDFKEVMCISCEQSGHFAVSVGKADGCVSANVSETSTFCHCCLPPLFEVISNSWPANTLPKFIHTLSALLEILFCADLNIVIVQHKVDTQRPAFTEGLSFSLTPNQTRRSVLFLTQVWGCETWKRW